MNIFLILFTKRHIPRIVYCFYLRDSVTSAERLKIILGETSMSQTQMGPKRGSPPGTPRWVKVLVILFIVLILLVVILHLTGNDFGGHHMSSMEYWLQRL